MTLLSPFEDVVRRTMAALPNALARLAYVAGLRNVDGKYGHWGFQRVHGDAAAQDALAEVHREVLLQVLRTPLRNLKQEQRGRLDGLSARHLLPETRSKAAEAHLSSVLLALAALQPPSSNSSHRDA